MTNVPEKKLSSLFQVARSVVEVESTGRHRNIGVPSESRNGRTCKKVDEPNRSKFSSFPKSLETSLGTSLGVDAAMSLLSNVGFFLTLIRRSPLGDILMSEFLSTNAFDVLLTFSVDVSLTTLCNVVAMINHRQYDRNRILKHFRFFSDVSILKIVHGS